MIVWFVSLDDRIIFEARERTFKIYIKCLCQETIEIITGHFRGVLCAYGAAVY
jgi:hypothetical protein